MSFSATSESIPGYDITLGPAQMEPMSPHVIDAPPLVVNIAPTPSQIPILLAGISLLTVVLIMTGTLNLGRE
jgi:hypothetical protein